MELEITLFGNPILRRRGALVSEITPEIRQLADDMIETMHAASGIGLAAQQVGQALQMAVIDIPADTEAPSRMWVEGRPVDWREYMPLVLLNPDLQVVKKKSSSPEGCLSFPGITGEVSRPIRVTCSCMDLNGQRWTFEADGLLGRAVLHEVDHLNGVLFTDHMHPTERASLRGDIEEIRQRGLKQAEGGN